MEKTVVKMERKEKRAVLNRVKGCAAIILYSWCFGSSVFLYFLLLLLLLHTCTPFIKTLNRRRLGLNFFFIVWGPFLIPPHNNLSSRILIRSLSFHALETGTYIPFRGSVELRKKKDFPSGSDDQKKRGKEGGAVRREKNLEKKKRSTNNVVLSSHQRRRSLAFTRGHFHPSEPRPIAHFPIANERVHVQKIGRSARDGARYERAKSETAQIKRVNRPNGEREFGFGEEVGENGDGFSARRARSRVRL